MNNKMRIKYVEVRGCNKEVLMNAEKMAILQEFVSRIQRGASLGFKPQTAISYFEMNDTTLKQVAEILKELGVAINNHLEKNQDRFGN